MLYLWLKALHVIAVIAWMASLLYLPRLMVYHCEAEPGSKQSGVDGDLGLRARACL
jgi:putative membrane protein